MTKTIEISTDCSGKTFQYKIKDDVGEILLEGDGYETEKEIKDFWHKMFIVLKKANQNGEFD